jgi:NAD(P)H-flavin reductase
LRSCTARVRRAIGSSYNSSISGDACTTVDVTVDAASSEWTGNVGVVTTLISTARVAPADAVAFICGPEVMMRFSARALLARGMTEDQIFVSMERNMKCGVGFCGHCQLGPAFICKDGPVFRYDRLAPWLGVREL